MINFIKDIPKAELHIHIEGSLEPLMMFELAKKNNINIPYKNIDEVKKAYEFDNLQSFLDIYYKGAEVLITKEDFFDLTWAYLLKCHEDNVIHTEIFFDPQSHTSRGIKFETVILGINEALIKAKNELNITSNIIMCFLRHLSQDDAFKTLEDAFPYKDLIVAVGLDSSEIGHPPSKFEDVFLEALKQGYKTVAHAGEEADFTFIYKTIDLLKVSRIDHGVQAINSNELMISLKDSQMPLTVCPFSNIELKVFDKMSKHNIKKMLDFGINVCVNSDDPSYFKGYMNDNLISLYENLSLNKEDIIKLVKNSINSSFISYELKNNYIKQIDEFILSKKL